MSVNNLKSLEIEISEIGQVLFQSSSEGVLVLDSSFTIRMINPKLTKMLGFLAHELIGKSIETLLSEESIKKYFSHREKQFELLGNFNSESRINLEILNKDAVPLPTQVLLSPFLYNGDEMLMWIIRDLTELKKAEKDILDALQKEKHLNELKSRFLSLTSHEFRTPLTSILSSAFLLSKYVDAEGNKEKKHKHINLIKASVNHLTKILNDFLSLEQLEEGKVEFHTSSIDITAFCNVIASDIQQSGKKGQKIIYKHEGSETFIYDKQMLKYILNNLLSNALKYSPENSLVLFNTQLTNLSLIISITDFGIGIPLDEQNQIFDRFFRAKNASNIQGTGLGLNIIKKYVEMSNGEISFLSQQDKGTTFTIKLPVV